mmetsp:Transcript_19919/g.61845  ORF Transcript_19919/g.61845 Transcript_19919/m.61845 type:complete len:294 (-) Transcript_19919:13-894(-)
MRASSWSLSLAMSSMSTSLTGIFPTAFLITRSNFSLFCSRRFSKSSRSIFSYRLLSCWLMRSSERSTCAGTCASGLGSFGGGGACGGGGWLAADMAANCCCCICTVWSSSAFSKLSSSLRCVDGDVTCCCCGGGESAFFLASMASVSVGGGWRSGSSLGNSGSPSSRSIECSRTMAMTVSFGPISGLPRPDVRVFLGDTMTMRHAPGRQPMSASSTPSINVCEPISIFRGASMTISSMSLSTAKVAPTRLVFHTSKDTTTSSPRFAGFGRPNSSTAPSMRSITGERGPSGSSR